MKANVSLLLNNTKKDLIGRITAAILLAAFLRSKSKDAPLDSDVKRLLSEEADSIRKFIAAAASAGLSRDIMNETSETVADLVPKETNYYNNETVNALLSLWDNSKH